MDPLSGATSVMAVMQLTASIVQICGKYLSNVKNARQDIRRLQDKMAALAQVLQSLDDLNRQSNGEKLTTTQGLAHNITKCSSTLANLKEKIDPGKSQSAIRKWGLRAFKWPLARAEVDDAITELESYKTTFSLSLHVDQVRSTNLIQQKIDLIRLQTAKGAAHDSYDNQHSECLPGTRVNLLKEIEEWAKSPHGKCIFWLNGMAGTGKSTISRTVASRLEQQQLLGGSFFFKRGEEDRGRAKKLFPTLAEQLVIRIPQMLPRVQEAITKDPHISEKILREQFEKLLLDPLLEMKPQQGTASRVIVIDALDECDLEDDIRIILRLLPQVQRSKSVQLRFLLTSRPDLPIRLGFKEIIDDHQGLVLHKIEKSVIEHDISLYLKDQLLRLKQRHPFPPDWPGNAATRELVNRAIPLFIAAVTLCRFICDVNWNPQKRLEAILKDKSTYASKMDGTYIPVLNQLLTGQDETESQELLDDFKETVGVVIILATPLSINSLSQLVKKEPDDIKCRLDQLHSVLTVPNDVDKPVRILHLSFRDFLLDHNIQKSKFWINSKVAHQHLTAGCLRIMRNKLKKNICSLPSEGTEYNEISKNLIQDNIHPELKYACRYWVYHLLQCSDLPGMIDDAVLFLQTHLLHWVEALSLLRFTSEILGILDQLQRAISVNGYQTLDFLRDTKRLILKNRQIVDRAPLQIYCAALVFAPRTSIIRMIYEHEIPKWICQLPQVEEKWGALTQTLEGHSHLVSSVAFSPSGCLLASGSYDGSIRVWDSATGMLTQTLKGNSGRVDSVAFSSDDRLASGSGDGSVHLWDTATGILTQTFEGQVLKEHSEGTSVAFSPDGSLVASSSGNNLVRLWDTATGVLTQTLKAQVLDGHTIEEYSKGASVAFSSDGRLLASSSGDWLVRLWDTAMGVLTYTLRGSSGVRSVAFSPNGCLLASGSYDGSIHLWDTATGALIQTLEGHSGLVLSVAFSPDGVLASCSGDGSTRLWDAATGAVTRIFKGHSDWVWSVAFSPDGRLVTGSSDGSVRLWDVMTDTSAVTQGLEGLSSRVEAVAFSPDGRLLASASGDRSVRLWDVTTGAVTKSLEGHSGVVLSVAFSADSQLLASASGDRSVRIWNAATGELIQTLEAHWHWVWSVTFSPDARILASGSRDRSVRIWDVETGALTLTLQGHFGRVLSVAFSPDGRLLASGSDDHSVRLWDPETGVLIQTWQFEETVATLKFSHDGLYIHTNFCFYDVQSRCDRPTCHSLDSNMGISIEDNQWIKRNDKKVLWLPVEFRPTHFAIHANVLALASESGQVSFIRLYM